MNSRYRLIQFVPDHFSGSRFSIGAIVEGDDGVRLALARHIPGAECLGSDSSYMLLRHSLDELRHLRRFDRLPLSLGPHFELSEPKDVDVEGVDSVRWLRENILPRPLQKEQSEARKRGPNRSTIGKDHLKKYGVDRYVRSFDLERDLPMLNGASDVFPTISQSVGSDKDLILMEPIAPQLKSVARHVKEVTVKLSASQRFLKDHEGRSGIEFIAYVTPGGKPRDRAEFCTHLAQGADRVFDMNTRSQRRELVDRIEDVGSRVEDQVHLS